MLYALMRDFNAPFERVGPGMARLGRCGSFFTGKKTKKVITGKYLVLHFSNIQRALEGGQLGNSYRLPGSKNPAGGVTRVRSDTFPPTEIRIGEVQSRVVAGTGGTCEILLLVIFACPPATALFQPRVRWLIYSLFCGSLWGFCLNFPFVWFLSNPGHVE